MREIKFRGIILNGKGWVFGDLVHDTIDAYSRIVKIGIKTKENYPISVTPESVGQYTGLKDKDGKEIYEGDIINWGWNNGKTEIEQVKHSLDWDGELSRNTAPFMSAWGSTCGRYFRTFMNIYDPTRYASIIGNIHEHKHLLK